MALLSRADKARIEIAKYLREVGFEVFECEELSIVSRFSGIVLIDGPDPGAVTRAHVLAWTKVAQTPRRA